MDFVFIDVGQAEIFRQLGTPPPAFVQPFVEPPVTLLALACRGYIDGEEPSSCPKEPTSPTGGITGGHQSPDTAPPKEEGLEHTIDDNDLEGLLSCTTEQNVEADIDTAAQQFAEGLRRDLANNSLDATLEHGALIVQVDGQTYALPLVTGTATMIPFNRFTDGPNGLIASNLTWSNIVGVVHSHPTSTEATPLERRNDDLFQRGPSPGDVAAAEFFSQLGGGQNVTSYIISPEGDLLEYEGYEQPDWVHQGYEDDEIESEIENATSENESDAAGECS